MITTITLNPCIDRTVMLPSVSFGKLNIVEKSRSDIGGKGINVAVALKQLGVDVSCSGISFDGDSVKLREELDGFGIPHDFIVASGNMRMNVKIVETAKKEMTELNSPGEPVSKDVLDRFLSKLKELGSKSEIIVFAGRLPVRADADYYYRCIDALAGYTVKFIVDAAGEPLKHAIAAKPFLIKPNAYELGMLYDTEIKTVDDAVLLSRKITDQGVGYVCCSLGENGAVLVDSDNVWFASALNIEPKGFQGAGDSMIAGICKAMAKRLPPCEMLRYGTAAAAASLIREGTLLCQKSDFELFLKDVEVKELAI